MCFYVQTVTLMVQLELSRNKCRDKRIDVWPRAVDTAVFSPAFQSHAMRERLTDGNPEATILVYVGRLGAGRHAPRVLIGASQCAAWHPSESFLDLHQFLTPAASPAGFWTCLDC